MVRHVLDYPNMNHEHWDFEHRGGLSHEDRQKHHIQIRSGFVGEANKHFVINDLENPYTEVKRFDWIRGNQVGGRSLLGASTATAGATSILRPTPKRASRWIGPSATKTSNLGTLMLKNLWALSGEKLGLAHLPDGHFLPPMELNCIETRAQGN